jgi:subtilisin family serine protease
MRKTTLRRPERLPAVWRALGLTCVAGLALGVMAPAALGARPGGMPGQDQRAEILALRSARIDMSAPGRNLARTAHDLKAANAGSRRVFLQVDGPMTRERRAVLANVGVRLLGYAGAGVHVANIAKAEPESLAAIDFVTWSAPIEPAWKIDSAVGHTSYASDVRKTLLGRNTLALLVTTYEDADASAVARSLQTLPGVRVQNIADSLGVLNVIAPLHAVERIAGLDDVAYVEETPEASERNLTVRWIVQSNINNFEPLYTHGLTGTGQIIGMQDGYPREDHCALDDTVAPGPSHRKFALYGPTFPLALTSVSNHGTHVAGTLAGDQGSETNARGVAYDARIAFTQSPNLSDVTTGTAFAANLQANHDAGGRVHTNSWGDDSTSTKEQYKGWSRIADKFMHDNEEDLIVFAITNFSTSFNSPENAKNIIAVAATEDSPNQDAWGSGGKGPTRELDHLDPLDPFWASSGLDPMTYGRFKPDIMAPGKNITSSVKGTSGDACATGNLSGTSMATPAVSGVAALMRQYYMDGFYPSGAADGSDAYTPTGALLKATVLNSGQDALGPGPGFVDEEGMDGYPTLREGWGRVTADDTLHFTGDTRTLQIVDVRHADGDALNTTDMNEHIVHVRGSGEQLRVTMAFTDPEPAPGALDVVINDIDLEVVSPSGVTYKGNVFDQMAGVSITGGSFDPRNNVEQVHVSSPEIGPWKVRVYGTEINEPAQGYALAMTGQIEVTCIADLNNDNTVDGADLAAMLAAWGLAGTADLNGDGVIDGADLAELLAAWGSCP